MTETSSLDHDLLLKTANNSEAMCRAFAKFEKINSKEHGRIFTLLEKRVPNWVFFPIISLIVLIIISLTAYTGNIKAEVEKNKTCIENIEKNLSW